MAGKTKRNGGSARTPRTPKATEMPNTSQLGHLGLKSSPYAPTDCKLVSQFMVRDRMAAHYKKLNKARAAVDSGPPKAYLVSQKMRDRARREAMKFESQSARMTRPHSARRHSLHESDLDKAEIQAMMESLSHYDDDDGYDDFHNTRINPPRTSTSMELHPADSNSEMQFVNKMVDDNEVSPSRYATNKSYKSNIPQNNIRSSPQARSKSPYATTRIVAQKPLYKTQLLETYTAAPQPQYSHSPQYHHQAQYDPQTSQYYDIQQSAVMRTPRSKDVIDQHNDKFTEAKPFQPRTLKSNRTSKLSQFKYYTPPPKKGGQEEPTQRPESSMSKGSMKQSIRSRPSTANTQMTSTDWMNETIVSRDFTERETPTGIPKLDITLDGDNINWLKEQSGKAKLRKTLDRPSKAEYLNQTQDQTLMDETTGLNSTYERRGNSHTLNSTGMNGAFNTTLGFLQLLTTRKLADKEEELQYLEFIQDVTSDVLDRGIFTNRMLKQVFESHVIKRRHQLDETKMREKLEDLRIELGIPMSDEGDYEGMGLTSTLPSNSRANRRTKLDSQQVHANGAVHSTAVTTPKKTLPNLHATKQIAVKSAAPRGRSPSPDSKPPLPRGGTRSLEATLSHDLTKSQELRETTTSNGGDSVFGTLTQTNTGTSADILKVEHDELAETLNTTQGMDDTLRPEDDTIRYQQHLQASLDRSDSEVTESEDHHGNDGETHRTDNQPFTDRTEISEHAGYTERTESHSVADEDNGSNHTFDVTPQNTSRNQSESNYPVNRNLSSDNEDYGSDEDDFEKEDDSPSADDFEKEEDSPRAEQKRPKPSPRRRRKEGNNNNESSATSHDHTSDTLDVSELDDDENNDNF